MLNMMDRIPKATKIIRNHMLFSMGGSLIPLPLADTIAITGVQLDMIYQLSQLYKVNYREAYGKTVLVSLVGAGLSRIWASFLKGIPIVGPIIGGASMSVFSGAMTFAIGEVYLMHLEEGGTLADFDWKRYESYFRQRFAEGKRQANLLQNESNNHKKAAEQNIQIESSSADPETILLKKLENLTELKNSGILTEEEFEELKRKIIKGK
ncbi:MAG: DUF697 domain-containing protein [Bacteroidetes bacterium]|nr:MAG: DUF697 domain-containing protein [Bacteroidota bacterium]